jgi:MraZ protein
MFLGRYQHTLDDKGRLTVPARYRQLLAEGGYITQGFGQNLMVMRVPTFESLAEQINNTSLTNPKAEQLREVFFSTADFFEPDKSGRILVPQSLRNLHNLEGELALVGMGSHFNIWPQDVWPERDNQLQIASGTSGYFEEHDLRITYDGK